MRALLITIIWASLGLSNTTLAETRLTVGVALPRAQLGQGNGASADVAEPVRQALMSYLKGPKLDVIVGKTHTHLHSAMLLRVLPR